MASSSKQTASSSSSSPQWKYSVFINFRGEDTRIGFVSHLYNALVRHGIHTFKDDEELEKGNEFPPVLMEAIEGSTIFVVVISQNYASSSWCLNELVKIMQLRDTMGQTVIPVFYFVHPSHVRNQVGTFATAIADHGNSSKGRMWKDALTEVATISGLDYRHSVDEATLVEELVRTISHTLLHTSTSDMDGLVGIDKHLEKMSSLLSLGSNDVRMVGIWGMGGVGKTTIARALYDRFSRHFEGKCFLPNVKESFRKDGAAAARRELLSQIFMERNVSDRVLDGGSNMVKHRLRHKKCIIVLDDVNHMEQLEILAGRFDWFGLGSRIIITTRDKHLLIAHRVEHIYEVNGLENDQALQLFNQSAFRGSPVPDECSELCKRVTIYAKGLPLALKVLGSFLCGRSKREWESALKKLESIPNSDVQNVLRISYDDLDDEQKDIFLDIACFFNGERKDLVIEFLDSCGFHSDIGIFVLIDKSLLTVCREKLEMHDLLQEMGREIVRQESIKDPSKRSRLWIPTDVQRVLTSNMGSEKVEGILLDLSKSKVMRLGASTFAAMCNLRFLKFYDSRSFRDVDECKVNLPNGLESLSHELRYLHWHRYPLRSLPYNFSPENLVTLRLPYSNIEQLPRDIYKLKSLRRIDLSGCGNLRSFPEISEPMDCLSFLRLDRTGIKELHPSIENLTGLQHLYLRDCKELEHLPTSIWSLKSLEELRLSDCPNLRALPPRPPRRKSSSVPVDDQTPHQFSSLKMLFIDGNNFESLPENIKEFSNLEVLELSGCRKLKSLPELPFSLTCMIADNCISLETVSTPWHSISPKRGSYFYYTNCLKLSQNAESKIVKNFLRQIQYTGPPFHENEGVNLHMIHSHKVPHGYYSLPGLTVNIPGSEIPEFFSYQSTGSFLTADLPRDWYNTDFMGFAICAVIAFNNNDPEEDTSKAADRMNSDDDNSRNIGNFLVHYEFSMPYRIYSSADHIVMGYDAHLATKIGGDERLRNNISFKCTVPGGEAANLCCGSILWHYNLQVKKCGVGLIYQKGARKKEKA